MVAALRLPITRTLRLTKTELNDIARQVVRYFQDDIVEMNQKRLFSGKYTNNQFIKPDYKRVTVDIKNAKGQVSDHVTLKDTGDFYESIYTSAGQNSFYVGATDPKTNDLVEKYGDSEDILLGLSEEQIEQFRELSTHLFVEKYFERLR